MIDGNRIWTPQGQHFAATVAESVEAYRELLRVLYPEHLMAFDSRREADSDSACAEAVVFSVLRAQRLEPVVAEVLGNGGPDFLCLPGSDGAFFVEVTSLDRPAVERRSGWPDKVSNEGHWFREITRNLCNKCAQKAPQLADLPSPRVLAICSTHSGSGVLLGTAAAEDLMTPESCASTEGAPAEMARQIADLRISPFLEIQASGDLVPIRRSISAILLVTIHGDGASVLGMLHPDPVAEFDYRTLARVPFLRLLWPMWDAVPRTEWIVGNPEPMLFHHRPVNLSTAELEGDTLR